MNPLHDGLSSDHGASDESSIRDSHVLNISVDSTDNPRGFSFRSSFPFGGILTSAFRSLSKASAGTLFSNVELSSSPRTVLSSDTNATGSTLFGAGFNFVNSIVGAGIIGMPIAIKESGFFMGIILLVSIAWLVSRSTILLIDCGIQTKRIDLEQLCEHVLGPKGFYAATLCMFLYAFGAMIAYVVIIGDTVPVAFDFFFGGESTSKAVTMVLSAVFIILPLCLMRDMSSLASTSMLSITADFLLIIFICIRGPTAARNQETEFESSDVNFAAYTIFEGIGIFSFAFVCQHSSFIVYRSMKEPNLHNWSKVANSSLVVAGVMCLTLGLSGYLSFGSYTEGDILNNFSEDGNLICFMYTALLLNDFCFCCLHPDELMLAARLLLAITMLFTFPMECFVARHAVFSAYHKYQHSKSMDRDKEDAGDDTYDETRIGGVKIPHPDLDHEPAVVPHVVVTILLWGASLFIAVVFGDLRIVLALTGALAGSMLGYILPSVVYIKTYETDWLQMKNILNPSSNMYRPLLKDRLKAIKRFLLPLALLIFGLVAMVIGVVTILYDVAGE